MARDASASHQEHASAHQRMPLFDVLRGFSVLSMVLFHFCYDVRFVYGQTLEWFAPPFQDMWRASISWTFLFVAGCMCSFSHNNLKRSLRYLSAALAVYIITALAAVDTPISFGIIFCMGASTLIAAVLDRLNIAPVGWLTTICLFAAFVLCLGVPRHTIGVGFLSSPLPPILFEHRSLSFLGFPGPGFASGDYYPLIPYTLMYLTGMSAGRTWQHTSFPSCFTTIHCKPLEYIGQHALPIYLLHQPLLLILCELFFA